MCGASSELLANTAAELNDSLFLFRFLTLDSSQPNCGAPGFRNRVRRLEGRRCSFMWFRHLIRRPQYLLDGLYPITSGLGTYWKPSKGVEKIYQRERHLEYPTYPAALSRPHRWNKTVKVSTVGKFSHPSSYFWTSHLQMAPLTHHRSVIVILLLAERF